MEQGWTGVGGANGPSGDSVIRPGKDGNHGTYASYEAYSGSPVAGWAKVDDVAGEIDKKGVGHGHFSNQASGQSTSAGPWKQT